MFHFLMKINYSSIAAVCSNDARVNDKTINGVGFSSALQSFSLS